MSDPPSLTYQSADELIPGKGYWIRASADGEICLWNC